MAIEGFVYTDTGQPLDGRTVRAYRDDTGVLLGSAVTGVGGEANSKMHLPLETDAVDVSPSALGAFDNVGGVTFDGTRATFSGSNRLQKTGIAGFPAIGTGDFTADYTVMIPVGVPAADPVWVVLDGNNLQFFFDIADTQIRVYLAGGEVLAATIALVRGQESFVRIKRASGTLTMHFNGAQVGSVASTQNVPALTTIDIANYQAAYYMPAGSTLRHLRIVVGEALAGGGQIAPLPFGAGTPGKYTIATAYTGPKHVIEVTPPGTPLRIHRSQS
jgi:hypothetical protein